MSSGLGESQLGSSMSSGLEDSWLGSGMSSGLVDPWLGYGISSRLEDSRLGSGMSSGLGESRLGSGMSSEPLDTPAGSSRSCSDDSRLNSGSLLLWGTHGRPPACPLVPARFWYVQAGLSCCKSIKMKEGYVYIEKVIHLVCSSPLFKFQ